MNHYFFETRAREKIRELQAQGMASQAAHRSGAIGADSLTRLRNLLRRISERRGKQSEAPKVNPQLGTLQVKPRP